MGGFLKLLIYSQIQNNYGAYWLTVVNMRYTTFIDKSKYIQYISLAVSAHSFTSNWQLNSKPLAYNHNILLLNKITYSWRSFLRLFQKILSKYFSYIPWMNIEESLSHIKWRSLKERRLMLVTYRNVSTM